MTELSRGKIETVCGPIDASQLGMTLCHEHLYHEATSRVFSPRQCDPKYEHINKQPVSPRTNWWTQFHPYSHQNNLEFLPSKEFISTITEEMQFFKSNGGTSVVEVTTFGKKLSELKQTALQSGVNIIAGAGYYVTGAMKDATLRMTTEEIYNSIKNDLLEGENGIKCGVIGEIASEFPINPFEKKVLEASGMVQEELGVAVSVHPGRNVKAPAETIRILQESGGIAGKTVMSHLESMFCY